METLKKTGESILTAGFIFLIFITVFYSRLHIPPWLQVAGRMHPMFLHFPIVLLLLSFFTFWMPQRIQSTEWFNILRLAAALSATISAIMGLLLSLEGERNGTSFQWHKWTGISVALLSFFFYSFHYFFSHKIIGRSFTVIAGFFIVAAGHFGASLTHGENYLLAPVTTAEKKVVSIDNAMIFADVIKPIFERKCFSCHGAESMKGGLALEDSAAIISGGKTGPLFIAGSPDSSLLIHRILLPADEKKHMPPVSKPALADDEIALLKAWIKSGGLINKKVTQLQVQDSFRIAAAKFLGPSEKESGELIYDFAAADDKKINALDNNNRVIEPQGTGSPALSVHFYGKSAYSKKALEELLPLKQQIIQLSLARMPVKDEDLTIIKQMINLRSLNLNYTNITSEGLKQLTGLQKLREIALSGIAIDRQSLEEIAVLPSIKFVYIWNSAIDSAQVSLVRNKFKKVKIETGFADNGTIIALSPPVIKNITGMFDRDTQIVIKHPFPGADIRYTLDGSAIDSLKSPLYKNAITIKNSTVLAAKAYKKGWYGSAAAEAIYIKKGIKPDSIELLTAPDAQYHGSGKLLCDGDIGDTNFGNGQWLGYTKNNGIFYLYFNNPAAINNVLFTILNSIGSYIFPPVTVEIWGGAEKNHLKLLGKTNPVLPLKDEPSKLVPLQIAFTPTTVKCLKIVARPIKLLPKWHAGKGKPGWVLISEIAVN